MCVQLRINSDFNTVSFHPVYLNLTWRSRYLVNLFYFFVLMASEKNKVFSTPTSTPHRRIAATFGSGRDGHNDSMPNLSEDVTEPSQIELIERRLRKENDRRFVEMQETLMTGIEELLRRSGVGAHGNVGDDVTEGATGGPTGGDAGGAGGSTKVKDDALGARDRDRPHFRRDFSPPLHRPNRDRINVSSINKLEAEVSLRDFITWRNRWNDLVRLEKINDHPMAERTAALRMSQATPSFGPKSGRVRLSSADRPTCPISNRIRAELGFYIRAEFLKL